MNKLEGVIEFIGETVQVSDKFKKRELVIVDRSGQYEQFISFNALQDRCELLDQYKVGEQVEVTYFVRGRKWENPKDGSIRYFNSLDLWTVNYTGEHADAIEGGLQEQVEKKWEDSKESDSLPF